jgi:AraC-like DNA-binding protein
MVALMERLAPVEGYNLSALPGVRLLRSNRPLLRTPVLYEPGIVIVCQGRKRGFLGEQVYLYDAQHYLAVAVPVPFSMETEASETEPMLAIYLHLDLQLTADLLLELEERGQPVQAEPKGMLSTPMDKPLATSVLRLLEALTEPLETAILGRALVREIYFRVLTSEQGASMRAALMRQGRFATIARALRKIHACFSAALDVEQLAAEANMSVATFHHHFKAVTATSPMQYLKSTRLQGRFATIARALRKIHASFSAALDVEQLAAEANMSVATFHHHFKAVTATSPMQYLKSTRLHQARLLMIRNGTSVAAACASVGYESSSQFSREFKRLFGRSPVEEVAYMRKTADCRLSPPLRPMSAMWARSRLTTSPPFWPARRASSESNSCAVPFWWAAWPPLLAI